MLRTGIAISFILLLLLSFADAQDQTESVDAMVQRLRGLYVKSENPKEREGILLYCKDRVSVTSMPDRIRLKKEAIKLMEQNKPGEAATLLERANDLERLDRASSIMACNFDR